jgi:hypothetical protein
MWLNKFLIMVDFLQKIKAFWEANRGRGQEGIAIYLALVTLSIVLAIALGAGALVSGRIKMLNEAGDSVVAFTVAETGVEQTLLEYYSDSGLGLPYDSGFVVLDENTGKYQAKIYLCESDDVCIKSTGYYKNTQRAVEVRLP